MKKPTVLTAIFVLFLGGVFMRLFYRQGKNTELERLGEMSRLKAASQLDSLQAQASSEDDFYDAVSRLIREKKLDSAEQLVDTALAYDPHNVRLMVNKGMVYDARRQYDSAVYEYNLAMERYGDSLALTKMAETYIHKKQPGEAIRYYQILLSHYPGDSAIAKKLTALQHTP